MFVKDFLHNSRAHISESERCFNVKFSIYYFHTKMKILADFQICISGPLILCKAALDKTVLCEANNREISRKRSFEMYCLCDKAYQCSALQSTPWRSYSENLTIDNKFINKRVRFFIYQTMCLTRVQKKKLLGHNNRVAKWFSKKYRSSHWTATSENVFMKLKELKIIHKEF